VEARERRLGEILAKAFAGVPWKGETQGSIPRVGRLNPWPRARGSRWGEIPGTGVCWAGPTLRRREHRQAQR